LHLKNSFNLFLCWICHDYPTKKGYLPMQIDIENQKQSQPSKSGLFELPRLDFEIVSLEPVLSSRLMTLHYEKHHRGYVDKLNQLLQTSELKGRGLDEIVHESSGDLFNQAAQHWNHSFFWRCLRPASERQQPRDELKAAIESRFASIENFKHEFQEQAVAIFGSGWMWLAADPQRNLHLIQTKDAGCPITLGLTPILTCDVWEHAYYVDFENDRSAYLKQFWDVVNWEFGLSQLQKISRQLDS